jgi:hypothetical protein
MRRRRERGGLRWYQTLKAAIEANIKQLKKARRGWWTRLGKPLMWALAIASLALATAVAALILAALKG